MSRQPTRIAATGIASVFAQGVLGLTIFTTLLSIAAQPTDATNRGLHESADSETFLVDHVMINATDLKRSHAWYTQTLGFREEVRWTVDGLEGTTLSYLERDGFRIELVSSPESPSTAQLPRATDFADHFAQRGITHLCFRVEDVDQTLKRLNERGTPIFSGPIDFPPLGVRVGFVQDPDGNVIEFKGPLAGRDVVRGKASWIGNSESRFGDCTTISQATVSSWP
ncbi:MAG: VOC family protein [Planctomycetota bacterium]